jgi:hypothetical protein
MLDDYLANAERICGILLDFFSAEKIKYLDESNSFVFPIGTIELHYTEELEYWLEIAFDYKKTNWKPVDDLISRLSDSYLNWDGLSFSLKPKLEISALVRRCKERELEILSFSPAPPEKLVASAKGWGSAFTSVVVFRNSRMGSVVSISPSQTIRPALLGNKFYEVINPDNILEFLKGCLKNSP